MLLSILSFTASLILKLIVPPNYRCVELQDVLINKNNIVKVETHDKTLDISTNICYNGNCDKYTFVFKTNREAKKAYRKVKSSLKD